MHFIYLRLLNKIISNIPMLIKMYLKGKQALILLTESRTITEER